jgi:hypothetical protein
MNHSDFYTINDICKPGLKGLYPHLSLEIIDRIDLEGYIPEGIVRLHRKGKKFGDFVFSGHVGLLVVSRRIIELFEKYEITGYKAIPTTVIDSDQLEYCLLAITSRCTAIDYSKSEVFIHPPIVPDGPSFEAYRGLPFEIESWDGSDFFRPYNSRWTIVTNKVKDILISHKATNVEIKNITDVVRFGVTSVDPKLPPPFDKFV